MFKLVSASIDEFNKIKSQIDLLASKIGFKNGASKSSKATKQLERLLKQDNWEVKGREYEMADIVSLVRKIGSTVYQIKIFSHDSFGTHYSLTVLHS